MSGLRPAALACALALGVGAIALPASPSTAASVGAPTPTGPSVSIDNFTFGPAALTVKVGATVTWTNRDDVPHTVTATDRSFKSPVLDTDGVFSFTFAKPGEYDYFCSLHPHMVGKVIVNGS